MVCAGKAAEKISFIQQIIRVLLCDLSVRQDPFRKDHREYNSGQSLLKLISSLFTSCSATSPSSIVIVMIFE